MNNWILRRILTRPRDPGTWITESVFACRYPKRTADVAALAAAGITVVVNLHRRRHDAAVLTSFGLIEHYIPVRDFTTPNPRQLEEGIAAIVLATAANHRVAVHCAAGLGRTGTLLSCYLVHLGQTADEAIGLIRTLRPGSVETRHQVQAVAAYERRHTHGRLTLRPGLIRSSILSRQRRDMAATDLTFWSGAERCNGEYR